MKRAVFFFTLFLSTCFGQEPSYFTLGEDELAGIDIYDLFQDDDLNYWIASNGGIFKFDGYEFRKMECDEMLSSSVFNLRADYSGNIYCNNLSGQIFQIKNDSCNLYYQIPDSLMSHEIGFNFDVNNRLTIVTRKVFQIDQDGNLKILMGSNFTYYIGGLFRRKNGNLICADPRKKKYYEISNGEITEERKVGDNDLQQFFFSNDKLYAFDAKANHLFVEKGKEFQNVQINNPEQRRFYGSRDHIWEVFLSGGLNIYNGDLNKINSPKKVLITKIISSMLQDKEDNILIGTFGNGILVIPNMNARTYQLPAGEKPTRVVVADEGRVFVGSQGGSVYEINGRDESVFFNNGSKHVESLAYIRGIQSIIVDHRKARIININSKKERLLDIGALKDVYQVDDSTIVIASNLGVFIVDFSQNKTEAYNLPAFKERTHAAVYDAVNNIYYVGTASGLKIGTETQADYYKLDNGPLLCRDILMFKEKAYVATQTQGALIFEKGELNEHWSTESGLPSNNLREILPYKGNFVISSEEGIFEVNEQGMLIRSIKNPEGLTSQRMVDIDIDGDLLYVVHNKGLQSIDLNKLEKMPAVPEVDLVQMTANGKRVDFSSDQIQLSSDENKKILFKLRANTIKYANELLYEYRLSDIDDSWQTNGFDNNIIEYKSLASGEYTFEYRTTCRGQIGPVHSLSFIIATPYWNSWWFYGIVFTIILIIITTIYKLQLNRQKKISTFQREMIASQLTAIQSQMNPHFIFNSLNSIQDLVLRQEGQNAYNYISKFAFLVRKVLRYSDKDFIDLDEELKMINVYLELEHLRFSEDFEFEIKDNEIEGIQIPPMLIQPFVENAIKHGLLHKTGLKKVTIEFLLKEDKLHCVIEDNGIGRKRSEEINKRKAQHHESFSVKSIRSRFDILKSIYGGSLGVTFEDLYEDEKPRGTRVDISIPVKRKF